MRKQASTLASWGVAIARAIDSYGVDSGDLFTQAGLEAGAMKNPNARYPHHSLRQLWRLAVEATGDPGFGITVARFVEPTTLHALGFSWLASRSLHEACTRLVRYYRIVTDAIVLQFEEAELGYRLSLRVADHQNPPVDESVDAAMATLVGLCRELHRRDFAPLQVELRRQRPENAKAFTDYFKAPLVFSAAQNILLLDKARLDATLPTGNAELAHHNDRIVADYLARFDNDRLSERVKTLIIDSLSSGKFIEAQIADELEISLRSLQRRLQDEQTSYKQLLDETRLDLALQYINRSQLTVAQIADSLGFSDPSNFNRAFKRWLGISPSEYRAQSLG